MATTRTLPTFRAAATNNDTGTTTLAVNLPTGTQATDWLIASIVVRDDRTVTTPSGWALYISYSALPNPGFTHYIFARVAGAETSPVTFTADSSTTWSGSMVAFSNVSSILITDAAVDGWGGPDASGFLSAPVSLTSGEATTVGEAPTLALYFAASRAEITVTWTAPSGFTERVDTSLGSTTLRFSQVVAEVSYATAPVPWSATPSGVHNKEGSAYLLLIGTTAWVPDVSVENTMSPQSEIVPFYDGSHVVWAGWNGGALVVEVNLGGSAFRLNDDVFGRLNSARLGPSADGWVDLGADMTDLEMTVGATQDDGVLSRFEAGTLRVELGNWDQKFDPLNAAGPYYQDLHVGTKVRVAGTQYQYLVDTHDPALDTLGTSMFMLFVGRIVDFTADGYADEDPRVTFYVEDAVSEFVAYDAAEQDPVGAGDDLLERIERITEGMSWDGIVGADDPHPEWPDWATFQATTMAQPAWTEMLLTCDAANTIPVVRGDGVLVIEPSSPDTSIYGLVPFGDPDGDMVGLDSADLAYGIEQVKNIIDAAQVGGSVQRFIDSTSAAPGRYGPRAWKRTDLPLQTDEQVARFGTFVLNHSSEAAPRITAMSVTPQVYGFDPYHDQQTYLFGVPSGGPVGLPVWWTLNRMVALRHDPFTICEVSFIHPHTGSIVSQRVMVRGASVVINDDVWEFRFTTTNVDSWFDIWTLADPSDSLEDAELSRLSRGHRLAAA